MVYQTIILPPFTIKVKFTTTHKLTSNHFTTVCIVIHIPLSMQYCKQGFIVSYRMNHAYYETRWLAVAPGFVELVKNGAVLQNKTN